MTFSLFYKLLLWSELEIGCLFQHFRVILMNLWVIFIFYYDFLTFLKKKYLIELLGSIWAIFEWIFTFPLIFIPFGKNGFGHNFHFLDHFYGHFGEVLGTFFSSYSEFFLWFSEFFGKNCFGQNFPFWVNLSNLGSFWWIFKNPLIIWYLYTSQCQEMWFGIR